MVHRDGISGYIGLDFPRLQAITQSRQLHEDIQKCWVIRGAQSSHWIPALGSEETRRATAGVVTDSNIVEGAGVGVQCWVHKPYGRLPSGDSLLVDPRQDRSKDWRRGRCPPNEIRRTLNENYHIVALKGISISDSRKTEWGKDLPTAATSG